MQQEKYDGYFSKINELYSQYLEVVSKKETSDFNEKWKSAYKIIREKLIIAVCKVYFDFEIKENTESPAVDKNNRYDDNYSDIVLEETINALESYENSSSKANGYQFSYYVCTNIRQELGKARSKTFISVNHGGACISDYEAEMTRKVIKKDKELQKLGIKDENKRNQKLEVLLDIGIETVQKYKSLSKCQTSSTEQEKDGKTYSVLDLESNLQEKNFITPESEFLKKELEEQLPILLDEMDEIFNKKADDKVSELLTVSLLDSFVSLKKAHIQDRNQMTDFYPFLFNMLSEYDCFNKEIIKNFFTDMDYILPTQKDITDKYGFDKSAASKILSRFRGKLKDNEKVKKYFSEFL